MSTSDIHLDPSGEEVQLTDPAFLRAQSVHAALQAAGGRVLMVKARGSVAPRGAAEKSPATDVAPLSQAV